MKYENNVKLIREKYKYTQLGFAVRLGVTQSAVSHWERGVSQPAEKVRKKLAKMAEKKGMKLKF